MPPAIECLDKKCDFRVRTIKDKTSTWKAHRLLRELKRLHKLAASNYIQPGKRHDPTFREYKSTPEDFGPAIVVGDEGIVDFR